MTTTSKGVRPEGMEQTVRVAVLRKGANGRALPFHRLDFSRVPIVGEHFVWREGVEERFFTVVGVIHIPRGPKPGPWRPLAEIRAVEDSEARRWKIRRESPTTAAVAKADNVIDISTKRRGRS